MAVISTPISSGLRLMVQTGLDAQGNPVVRARNFSRVKPSAVDQGVYDTGVAIGALQEHSVLEIRRTIEMDLVEG